MMHDVALRKRLAALVIAALLAISGAALATAYFAADAQTAVGNTGNAIGQGDVGLVGTDRDDRFH